MAMYVGAQTVVRTTEGDSKAFNVKVGLCYHCPDNLNLRNLILITKVYVSINVLEKCLYFSFTLHRFIARLEEQIHEWKLNAVTQGPPLTKVISSLNILPIFTA